MYNVYAQNQHMCIVQLYFTKSVLLILFNEMLNAKIAAYLKRGKPSSTMYQLIVRFDAFLNYLLKNYHPDHTSFSPLRHLFLALYSHTTLHKITHFCLSTCVLL